MHDNWYIRTCTPVTTDKNRDENGVHILLESGKDNSLSKRVNNRSFKVKINCIHVKVLALFYSTLFCLFYESVRSYFLVCLFN